MVRRPAKSKDFEAELPKSIDQLLAEKNSGSCANVADVGKAIREGTIPPGVTDIEKVRVDLDPARRREMMERSGRRTVPQIWIGERHVGGFDDLAALDHAGELDKLLAAS